MTQALPVLLIILETHRTLILPSGGGKTTPQVSMLATGYGGGMALNPQAAAQEIVGQAVAHHNAHLTQEAVEVAVAVSLL